MSEFQDNVNGGNGPMTKLQYEAAHAAEQERGGDRDMTEEERITAGLQTSQPQPVYIPKTTIVDAVSLAKAQGRFINAQTQFLMQGHPYDSPEYLDALSRYSRAQTELITAMQTALHQADII